MADISRQQKLASAKKKLKKYQQGKSPGDGAPPVQEQLGKEILHGMQSNHIFKTPPLTPPVPTSASGPNKVASIPNKGAPPSIPASVASSTKHGSNPKLNFSSEETSYFSPKRNSSPIPATPPSTPTITPATMATTMSTTPDHGRSKTPDPAPVAPASSHKTHPSLDFSDTSSNCSSDNEHSRERSGGDEDLEGSLASYKRANAHLGNQVNEQRKVILQLQEQIKKEGANPQLNNEQRALKEQLEVHIQTIGILVSEKSELQSTNSNMQKQLTAKDAELQNYGDQVKNFQQQCHESIKEIQLLQSSEGQLKQVSKEVTEERDKFSNRLYEVNQQREELALVNSELQSKLQNKVEECTALMEQVSQANVNLQQKELMVHQLSANGIDINNLNRWNEEKEELLKKVDSQNEMIKKLVYDKGELLEKHSETQGHYDMQIEALKNMISTLDNEKKLLQDKANSLSEMVGNLQKQLQEKENSAKVAETPEVDRDMKFNVELENTRQEKILLEGELDIQIKENRRLQRLVQEQDSKIEELSGQLQALREDELDKNSLLEQIQSEKETSSRAMAQNKSLKEQFEELTDGYVKVSNNSADLHSKLESEQNGNKDVATKLSQVQVELEENKLQLNEKISLCEDLEAQLDFYKTEAETIKQKMLSAEMNMETISTQLETTQHELQIKEENLKTAQENESLVEKLKEELNSTQNAVSQLTMENVDLTEKIEKLRLEVKDTSNVVSSDEGDLYPDREHFDDTFTSQEDDSRDFDDTEDSIQVRRGSSFDGLDTESVISDVTDSMMDDQEAMMITRAKMEEMETRFDNLLAERDNTMQLLEEERQKSQSVVQDLESHVQLQVEQCLKLRERELNDHFFAETEALQNKCKSLQDALEIMRKDENIEDFDMTSDGISMQSLKTAFMQLQKRYKKAMDSKAQYADRIEQLEHTNIKLENETETIGEYIQLYQAQRFALKKKFEDKDHVIKQLTDEHARMQGKVTQLHQLVMQMMAERSGIESKNKQLQELINKRLALQNRSSPDASPDHAPKSDLDKLFDHVTLTTEEEGELVKDDITLDNIADNTVVDTTTDCCSDGDQTRQQILQLFEQLEETGEGVEHGWMSAAARKHQFLPCKQCIGPLETL